MKPQVSRKLIAIFPYRSNEISVRTIFGALITGRKSLKRFLWWCDIKAGKMDAVVGRKGLTETGVVFSTCRHGFLTRAVDMVKGETYRHVHCLHHHAFKTGSAFVCYDIICNYWTFAKDVSEKINEFKDNTDRMFPFLFRWHGKAHERYCQVIVVKEIVNHLFLNQKKLFSDSFFWSLDARNGLYYW